MPLPRSTFVAVVLASTVLASTVLGGCAAPLVIGAAATAGYVGLQARPAKQVANDTDLKVRLKDNLGHLKAGYLANIGVDVFYGDVLLTGVVPTQAQGDQILQLVRQTPGVKKVYNELFVGAAYTTAQRAKDAWILTQIQPRLIGTRDAYPLNYMVSVVNNNVYVMGVCGSTTEKEHVLHVLATTAGVQKVHDYLTVDTSINTHTDETNTRDDVQAPNPFPESTMR